MPAMVLPFLLQISLNYAAIGELNFAYSKKFVDERGTNTRQPLETASSEGRTHSIDFASRHENKADYAFHMLLGHHGLFSLTPIWLLSLGGMIWALTVLLSAQEINNATRQPAPIGASWRA